MDTNIGLLREWSSWIARNRPHRTTANGRDWQGRRPRLRLGDTPAAAGPVQDRDSETDVAKMIAIVSRMINLSSPFSLWCRGRRHDKNLEPGKPIFNARETIDSNLRNKEIYI